VDQQGRVDLLRAGIGQVLQLVHQGLEQLLGRGGRRHDIAHLLLDIDRLGKRAQIEADDGPLQPLAGGGDDGVIVGIQIGGAHGETFNGKANGKAWIVRTLCAGS